MATKKSSLTSVDPQDVSFTAFAIEKSKDIPYEYVLVQIEFDSDDKILTLTRSKPMQFFMAVFEQKKRAATLWTTL